MHLFLVKSIDARWHFAVLTFVESQVISPCCESRTYEAFRFDSFAWAVASSEESWEDQTLEADLLH